MPRLPRLARHRCGDRSRRWTTSNTFVFCWAAVTAAGLGTFALTHDRLPLPAVFVLFVVVGLGFGATAAPTFAGTYRILPPAEHRQGTTALFMSVQLSAALGIIVLGLLQARAGADWISWLFALLAGAAVVMLAVARALPGRPAADG